MYKRQTLGFAAFSNTLTISSSATVSPDSSDFNINVYGIEDWQECRGNPYLELYTSSEISNPIRGLNNGLAAISATTAKIADNGKSITISDINVGLSGPSQSASYFFIIKNEGEYDAYLDLTEVTEEIAFPINGECTASENASPELVTKACEYVRMYRFLEDSSGIGRNEGEYLKISKGDYMELEIYITYEDYADTRADGDFTVAFEDYTLNFTSTPPAE